MKNKEEEKDEVINIPVDQLDVSDVENLDPNLDSKEEHYFVHWLKELIDNGAVLDADKNLMSIPLGDPIRHHITKVLKTKTKMVHRFLTKGCSYTPDFNVRWNTDLENILYAKINRGKELDKQKVPFITASAMHASSVIEVKSDFTQANKLQLTNMRILWLYEKNQYFVQMVKIPKLFKETFTPKAYMDDHIYKVNCAGGKKGTSRLKYKTVTCEEFLRKLKEGAEGQIPML